jgi:hypothetical protein
MGSGGSTLSTSTTLSYLGRQQAGRQSRSHVLRREGGDGSDESKARQRFLRVMNIVRHEANTVEAMNVKDYERRKRMISSEISFEIKRDHEDALAARRAKLAESGLLDDEDTDGEKDEDEDAADIRAMFYGMIGYELSSDDEQCEEEVHDLFDPVFSTDDSEVACDTMFPDNCKDAVNELNNVETTSRTSQCGDSVASNDDNDCVGESYSIYGHNGNSDSSDSSSCEDDIRHTETVSSTYSTSPNTSHDNYESCHQSSLELFKESVNQKKKQHVLHSIMRQKSLEEQQERSRRRLKRRKKKPHFIDSLNECDLETDEDFEGRKKVVKEFSAYEQLRRGSEHARENRQRESLNRRLDERKRQLQKLK